MDLLGNVLVGTKTHQHELAILCRVQHPSKIVIVQRILLDVGYITLHRLCSPIIKVRGNLPVKEVRTQLRGTAAFLRFVGGVTGELYAGPATASSELP